MGSKTVLMRHWSTDAACKGVQFEFVPSTETNTGLTAAQSWCNTCPVREECLMTAMKNGWAGYWGGTLTADRNRLKAPKNRAKCPLCKAVNVVSVEESQVCIACGRSWPKARPPVTRRGSLKRPTDMPSPQTETVSVTGGAL